MPRHSKHDAELTLQGTIAFGGRGFDRIRTVQKRRNAYSLFIDTNHGERCVAKLDMDDGVLKCYGNTRVPPFMELDLSDNAAKNLRRELEDAFDIEHADE